MNIVIADDDRTTRAILRTMLSQNFFNVIGEANDGEEAVKLCLELKPQIVFLDIDMPKLNGHEVTKKIREQYADIGVVIISALATAGNVKDAIQAGANAFVVKPFSPARVNEAIDQCRRVLE